MSFDSTFDYTAAIAVIDGIIATNVAQIAANNMKLACIVNLQAAYESSLGICCKNDELTKDSTYCQLVVDKMTILKTDIQSLSSLDSGVKTTIYTFYTTYATNRATFMSKLIYNASIMATNMATILADTNITNDDKVFLAAHLYDKYESYIFNTNWAQQLYSGVWYVKYSVQQSYATSINAAF